MQQDAPLAPAAKPEVRPGRKAVLPVRPASFPPIISLAFSSNHRRVFTNRSFAWGFLYRDGAVNALRDAKASGMAVWTEDGRESGRGRLARGWAGSSDGNPPLLAHSNMPNPAGYARAWAGSPATHWLLALLLCSLVAGVTAGQSPWLAALTLGSLAIANATFERRVRAARAAGLAALVAAGALMAFGWAGAAFALLVWRLAADITGLHRGIALLGPAQGMFAGLGVWPALVAGAAGNLLLGDAAFLGTALPSFPADTALTWALLIGGLGCASLWLAARIVSDHMREPLTRREAGVALIGSTVALALATGPDLAVGLSVAAALRLGLNVGLRLNLPNPLLAPNAAR